jgi:hypothetical protein
VVEVDVTSVVETAPVPWVVDGSPASVVCVEVDSEQSTQGMELSETMGAWVDDVTIDIGGRPWLVVAEETKERPDESTLLVSADVKDRVSVPTVQSTPGTGD